MQHDPILVELFTEAMSRQARGDAGGALLSYRRIQRRFPDFPDAWTNASALLLDAGRLEEALAAAERAAGLDGGNPAALYALADARIKLGRAGEAEGGLVRLLAAFPSHLEALLALASIYAGKAMFAESAALYDRAVAAAPPSAPLLEARGKARLWALDLPGAEADFRAAMGMGADGNEVRTDLAMALLLQGFPDRALEMAEMVVRRDPDNAHASWLRGESKLYLMDYAGAEADYRRALELDPGHLRALWSLGFPLLITGRYPEAFGHMRRHGLRIWGTNYLDLGKPHWKGEPLDGKTLLVYGHCHHVNGAGDDIQFARFLPRLRERCGCGRLMVYAYESLGRLFAGLPGADGFIGDGDALPDFDVAVPMWELLLLLGADLSDLPPPPLMPDGPPPPLPELARPGFKVGLVWAASAGRRLDPRLLEGLAAMPGSERIAWYGLQVPPDPDPPRLPGLTDMSPRIHDFMDTAQIIRQLDLVVTVDTAVAHLAGSLGAPTLVHLLQPAPCWRWGLGETTPWYPSVRLVRQPLQWDPNDPMGALKAEIARAMRGADA